MKRSPKVLITLVLAFCMGLILTGCQSQDYTPQPKNSTVSGASLHTDGVLRVGVDASSAPYAAQSNGDIMGIDVDIAAALADEMGLKLELVDVGSNVDAAFTQDNVDIVMGVESESEDYWTSNPYLESAIVIFATSANAQVPETGTFTIAAQSSSMSAWQVTDHFGDDHLVTEADLRSAFEALSSGRVNYVAADSTIGAYVAHSLGISAYPIALLQDMTEYRIACASTNTSLQTAVSNGISALQRGGIIDVIESKWLGEVEDLSKLPQITTTVIPEEDEEATDEEGTDTDTDNMDEDEDDE